MALAGGIVNGIFRSKGMPSPDANFKAGVGGNWTQVLIPDGIVDLNVVEEKMKKAFESITWEKRWADCPPVAKFTDIYETALAVGLAA